MRKTVVIDVVGLTEALLAHAPEISRWRAAGRLVARFGRRSRPSPARRSPITSQAGARTRTASSVTAGMCATTPKCGSGGNPIASCAARRSGISRERSIHPSPARICSGGSTCTRTWTSASRRVRCIRPTAGSSLTSTPKPARLRGELQQRLGTFPLFNFWGPRASIESTRWIAEAAKYVEQQFTPTLTLVYLPHLDYNLQRVGPNAVEAAADVRQVDAVCGDLIRFYRALPARR